MGNFKIEIEAVGGHGDFREVKQGEKLPAYPEERQPGIQVSPDEIARDFTAALAKHNNILSAKLIHWPDTTPIVDDLKTGIREYGDFSERWQGDDMLKHLHHNLLPDGPAREIARQFSHLAHMLVRTVPRSPERTVALRKLLEGMDAAIRAAKP